MISCLCLSLALLQEYLQGDSTRAYQAFGWKPKVTFKVR